MAYGQKVVTSVAMGAGLAVVATAVVARLDGPADGGWFMYSPNSTSYSPSSGGSTLRTSAVWLGAVATWFGISFRLLRSDK